MAQLDVVTSSIQYSLGMFPLQKVKEDLDAARATASLSKPDWAGTLEAVQSALAAFHWYTRQYQRTDCWLPTTMARHSECIVRTTVAWNT